MYLYYIKGVVYMEETLKWILPIIIPLLISLSTAWISSRNIVRKTKEETTKEIAAIREETAKEIAKVNAETSKELEIIMAQTKKEIELFQLQHQAKKDDAQAEIVNQIGSQLISEILLSSLKGKPISEVKSTLKDLKNLGEDLKKE
jgi:hypothetical protein